MDGYYGINVVLLKFLERGVKIIKGGGNSKYLGVNVKVTVGLLYRVAMALWNSLVLMESADVEIFRLMMISRGMKFISY